MSVDGVGPCDIAGRGAHSQAPGSFAARLIYSVHARASSPGSLTYQYCIVQSAASAPEYSICHVVPVGEIEASNGGHGGCSWPPLTCILSTPWRMQRPFRVKKKPKNHSCGNRIDRR